MRRTLMLLSTIVLALLLAGGLALVALSPAARADGDCQPSGSEVVCTYSYTGAAQSWTVPEGVTQATFDVFGAQGGRESRVNRPGGGGGKAHATIAVTPDDTLQINVGGEGGTGACSSCGGAGAGGFNGGAAAANSGISTAGGGGGASDIRTGDFALADRIIVAGGGGGAGTPNGGPGGAGSGGSVGGDGSAAGGTIANGEGGKGGTATSGGEGGAGVEGGGAGERGSLGVGGGGGSGSVFRCGACFAGGGGGGGGYYGGGGGSSWQSGGGGGGSGFVDPEASDVQVDTGVRGGNGLVTITYTTPDSTAPTVSSINRASSNPTNTTGNVAWTVTFSENVTGVDTADFALVNGGLGGSPTISSVTQGANASVYTVTASSGTGSGTLGLNLNDDDSIAEGAGNKLGGTGTGTAGGGETGNGSFTGEVYTIDRAAPTVSCSVSPSTMRLPANNHKLVDIRATVTVSDTGSGTDPISTKRFSLFSVTSSQLDSGLGTGDVPNDIQNWTTGTADTSGQFRAERYGGARIYTLTYRGTDVAGNTKDCLATVTVPKGG